MEYGAGKSTPTFETGYVVRNGDIVGITIVTSGNTQRIGSLVYPDELRNVPNTAWSGKGAVTVNGRTYTSLPASPATTRRPRAGSPSPRPEPMQTAPRCMCTRAWSASWKWAERTG